MKIGTVHGVVSMRTADQERTQMGRTERNFTKGFDTDGSRENLTEGVRTEDEREGGEGHKVMVIGESQYLQPLTMVRVTIGKTLLDGGPGQVCTIYKVTALHKNSPICFVEVSANTRSIMVYCFH